MIHETGSFWSLKLSPISNSASFNGAVRLLTKARRNAFDWRDDTLHDGRAKARQFWLLDVFAHSIEPENSRAPLQSPIRLLNDLPINKRDYGRPWNELTSGRGDRTPLQENREVSRIVDQIRDRDVDQWEVRPIRRMRKRRRSSHGF